MKVKPIISILLLLILATSSFAESSNPTYVQTSLVKTSILHDKIENLLKKEIQVECSKILLTLTPKNIIEQLSQISDQIKTVVLYNIDQQNCTFAASVETIDKYKISIFGMYKCLRSIPILKNGVAAGQIIHEKDIKIRDFDLRFLSSLSGDFFKNSEQIVGMQAKTNIKSDNFIYFHDVKNPVIIKAHDIIDLVLSGSGFTITVKGRAIQSGAMGDLIKVQNIKSKKALSGVIIDSKTVKIQSQ